MNPNTSPMRHNPLSMQGQGQGFNVNEYTPGRPFDMNTMRDHRAVDAAQRIDDESDDEHEHEQDNENDNDGDSDHKSDVEKPRTLPLGQKRRRVTRACDECRRKKIKCDGRQPCTHCSVYSYECTYDQPSNRRRNPGPQYIEALEVRLHKLEELMRIHAPLIDIDDPAVAPRLLPTSSKGPKNSMSMSSAHSTAVTKVKDESTTPTRQGSLSVTSPEIKVESEEDMLESMIADTTAIDLDEMGHWDFHGSSSGRVFLRQVGHRLGDVTGVFSKIPPDPVNKAAVTQRALSFSYDSPKSFTDSMTEEAPVPLPDKETARRLCDAAINNGMVLMRFVHEPTFWSHFDHLLDTEQGKWDNDDHLHLPMIYACMAMGSLFTDFEPGETQGESYGRATQKGFRYFKAAKSLIDLTDIRELPSLQTLIFMIFFIQSSAKIALCYSYLGLAIHSALRMGMHRCIQQGMTKIEQESRSRMFWMIKKMDTYMGALLGLPIVLAEEDIDQALPTLVDDENITATEIKPQDPDTLPLITGTVHHIKLLQIMKKVVKNVYPMRLRPQQTGNEPQPPTYPVSLSKIREIEIDLNTWMSDLDPRLHPNSSTSDMDKVGRIQRLLRMAYGHVQMALYRPFLHTVAAKNSATVDKRAHACGIACVNVARNIVHITLDMAKHNMLIGAYWFTMYTTFFAIVSLMYYLAENPVTEDNAGIYSDAQAGRQILASLADRSMSAHRCTAILNNVFEALGPRLDNKTNDLKQKKSKSKKRPAPQTVQQTPSQAQMPNTNASTTSSNENVQSSSNQTSDESVDMVSQPVSQFPSLPKKSPFPKWLSQNPAVDMSTPEGMTSGSSHQGSLSPEYLQASSQPFPGSIAFDKDLNVMPSMTDFSNMMFSPDDPLAYGNQPMLTLEKFGGDADLDINPFDMSDAAMMTGGMLDNYGSGFPKDGNQNQNPNMNMGMFMSGVSTPDSSMSMSMTQNGPSGLPVNLNVNLPEQTQRHLAEMQLRAQRQSLSTPSGQSKQRSRPTSQISFDTYPFSMQGQSQSQAQTQTSAPQPTFDMNVNGNMTVNANPNAYNQHMDMLGLGFDASSFGMGLGLGQDWTDFTGNAGVNTGGSGMQGRGSGGNAARKTGQGQGQGMSGYGDLDFSALQ